MYRQQKRRRPSSSFSAVGALRRVRFGRGRRQTAAARTSNPSSSPAVHHLPQSAAIPPSPLFQLVRKHRLRISTKQPSGWPPLPGQLRSDRAEQADLNTQAYIHTHTHTHIHTHADKLPFPLHAASKPN